MDKKAQKKKQRERESRKKVLALRKERAEAAKSKPPETKKIDPIRNAELKEEAIRLKIEHNYQILRALEQERRKEMGEDEAVALIPPSNKIFLQT